MQKIIRRLSRHVAWFDTVNFMCCCLLRDCKLGDPMRTVIGRTVFRFRSPISVNTSDIAVWNRKTTSETALRISDAYICLRQEAGGFVCKSLDLKRFVATAMQILDGGTKINFIRLRDTKSVSRLTPCIDVVCNKVGWSGLTIRSLQAFIRGRHKTLIRFRGIAFHSVHLFTDGVYVNTSTDLAYLVDAENLYGSRIGSEHKPLSKHTCGQSAKIRIVNQDHSEDETVVHVCEPYPELEVSGNVTVKYHPCRKKIFT